MALLRTALESCHRREELFQAAGAVSWDLHTSIALTKGSYKNIVGGHTGRVIVWVSVRVMSLGERLGTYASDAACTAACSC